MSTFADNSLPEFADGPPVPEMCEALLQTEDINSLFADLAACTSILSIQEKGSPQAYAESGPTALQVAKERLLNRSVRALQIRYSYQNREWTDTLMCLPDGVRLIRCQHPEVQTETQL